ncbi:MAG TPA: tetratricopeptide repeat protein [Candidatus Krumholzibacteria bacterium]|nr:tetratricopeptide repeat protein [Candidatus Krumholzibacteria bacterium]
MKMPHRNQVLVIALLVAAAAVAYFPAFDAGYNFDDRPLLQNNPQVKSLKNVPHFFASKDARVSWTRGNLKNDTYRPLQSVSFALSYSLWGDRPAMFHRENILLHAVNGVLLYFLLIALLDSTGAALLAALLFVIHPVQVEAVTYLSERASLLSMTFFLISICAFLASQRRETWFNGYTAISLAAFALSLLTKETAVILPVVLVLYCICFRDREGPAIKTVLARTWPYFLAVLIYIGVRTASLGQIAQTEALPLWQRLLIMTEVFSRYLGLTLFPRHLSFFPEINTTPFALKPAYIFYGAVLAAFIGLTVWLLGKNRRMAFFPAAYLVAFLPVSNIVPIKTFMQERFLYFPNAFMFPLVAFYVTEGLGRLGQRHGAIARYSAMAAAGLALVALTARTHVRNRDWQSQETLMLNEVKVHPGNGKAYYDLAVERFSRRDYDGARAYAEQALEHTTHNIHLAPIHNLMGKLDDIAGRDESAVQHYRMAIQMDPGYPYPYNSMGVIYARHGDFKQAIPFLEKAVELNPSSAAFYTNLGNAYFRNGDRDQALAAWNRSLAINPNQPDLRQAIRESGGQ